MFCKYPWYPLTPSVYYNGLSYYEDLCKLAGILNDVIGEIEKIDIDSVKSDVDYLKEQQVLLNKQMENLANNVAGVMDNVDNALKLYHNQVLMELASTTSNLTTFVNSQLSQLKIYIDSQDNAILSELRYQIELLKNSIPELTTVIVKSPLTGKLIPIQDAINELWDNLRVYALTAYEYDSMLLTAEKYDGFKLTAIEYDYYAKERIYSDPVLYPFSPWTGQRVFYQEILYKLVDYHRTNGITAKQYDDKKLTAQSYDSLSITAFEYDWNGHTVIMGTPAVTTGNVVIDPNSDGLTAYEQSKMSIRSD